MADMTRRLASTTFLINSAAFVARAINKMLRIESTQTRSGGAKRPRLRSVEPVVASVCTLARLAQAFLDLSLPACLSFFERVGVVGALSTNGNPSFATIVKVAGALGLRIRFESAA